MCPFALEHLPQDRVLLPPPPLCCLDLLLGFISTHTLVNHMNPLQVRPRTPAHPPKAMSFLKHLVWVVTQQNASRQLNRQKGGCRENHKLFTLQDPGRARETLSG